MIRTATYGIRGLEKWVEDIADWNLEHAQLKVRQNACAKDVYGVPVRALHYSFWHMFFNAEDNKHARTHIHAYVNIFELAGWWR